MDNWVTIFGMRSKKNITFFFARNGVGWGHNSERLSFLLICSTLHILDSENYSFVTSRTST